MAQPNNTLDIAQNVKALAHNTRRDKKWDGREPFIEKLEIARRIGARVLGAPEGEVKIWAQRELEPLEDSQNKMRRIHLWTEMRTGWNKLQNTGMPLIAGYGDVLEDRGAGWSGNPEWHQYTYVAFTITSGVKLPFMHFGECHKSEFISALEGGIAANFSVESSITPGIRQGKSRGPYFIATVHLLEVEKRHSQFLEIAVANIGLSGNAKTTHPIGDVLTVWSSGPVQGGMFFPEDAIVPPESLANIFGKGITDDISTNAQAWLAKCSKEISGFISKAIPSGRRTDTISMITVDRIRNE